MSIPTNQDILALLEQLDGSTADDLESQWLDFKPWQGPKADFKVAVEYAVCFANADGGAIIFGVADRTRGRAAAIHGASGYDLDTWRRGIFDATRPHLEVVVEELAIPEGTGTLLVVRAPAGPDQPYGTSQGVFKRRVGKNCMPMDAHEFARGQVSTGAVDWSGQPATGVTLDALDPVEIARARNVLRQVRPESDLLKLSDADLVAALGAVRGGRMTNCGLLLFGQAKALLSACPQHAVHYVHQVSDTRVDRNDMLQRGLLQLLEHLTQSFTGPANPEHELSMGLFKLRIPAYPLDAVREAVLNAVTHRDYADPGEVLVRHTTSELVITSPGGFVGGITPRNILRSEPISRNRTLAEAFQKLGLVERAGVGRRRIYTPVLEYGKRPPTYETDGQRVILRIFDGVYDERMALMVARWKEDGLDIDLDGLLVLSYLREHEFIDTKEAMELLQLSADDARRHLDRLAQPQAGILERRGLRSATFHLTKALAIDLLGKAAYTKIKGVDERRYRELVREFVDDHGSITPKQCRELLGLGESQAARVEASRLLGTWSGPTGFLEKEGTKGPRVRYHRKSGGSKPGRE